MVTFLLDHSADPCARDVFGNTPLDNARTLELYNLVSILDEYCEIQLQSLSIQ